MKWTTIKKSNFFLFVLLVFTPWIVMTNADTVDDRLDDLIDDYNNSPTPSLPNPVGKAGWAMINLHEGTNLTTANTYIEDIHDDYPVPDSTSYNFDSASCMTCLLRCILDLTCSANLTSDAEDAILNMCYNYINKRSKVANARGSVWIIQESENIDARFKSTFLLAALALEADISYGPNVILDDGYTIKTHRKAWQYYWCEYFRQRAREGINVEIASPQYAKYNFACYYNIMDLCSWQELSYLAEDFITLYWADTASDFLPSTGIRGGSETRCYKNNYLMLGIYYGLWHLTYAYDFHDNSPTGTPYADVIVAAISDYRVPDIVWDYASDTSKEPYMYTSRRPGKGTISGDDYTITFPSSLRRDSYVTSQYVLGSLTPDTTQTFTNISTQNRTLGVFFAGDEDDRIVFHGKATTGYTGYYEVYSACGEDCMVLARDPSASSSDGTRIFMSYGNIWNNRVEDSGWIFSSSGNSYAGIKIATGTTSPPYYVLHSEAYGKMLDLEDKWSPVVIQTGLSSEYASYQAFRNSVKANSFTYSSGKLTYISEAGDTYEIWRNSTNRPEINNTDVDVNPDKVYDSPFISGVHGYELITLSNSGYDDLILHFGNTGLHRDDSQTVAIWHMNTTFSYGGYTCVPDDDTENTSRNMHLQFYSGNPSLTTPGYIKDALDLDGDDYCKASSMWSNSYDTVKVQCWFYPRSTATNQCIATVKNVWEIWAVGGQTITFKVWDNASSAMKSISISGISLNEEHYLAAVCDEDGHMTLIVDYDIVETDHNPMRLRTAELLVGNRAGKTYYFDGWIDEMKISSP